MSLKVELYRYDLTNGMAAQMAPMLIGRPLEGVWHTAIVINGTTEYYFDGGVGIMSGPAGATRFGPPRRSEVLGYTSKSVAEYEAWNAGEMRSNRFGPNSYNLMECNCNHYSQAASQFLLGTNIPDDVRLMIPTLLATPLGRMIGPMLQQMSAAPGAAAGGIGATPFGQALGGLMGGAPSPAPAPAPAAAAPPSAAPLDADTQESLDIYIALIASDDASSEAKRTTLDALERIFSNIRNNPTNMQFQRLSLTSEFYKNKVAQPFESAPELLLVAGFDTEGETHLVFKGDVSKLGHFVAAIQKAKAAL